MKIPQAMMLMSQLWVFIHSRTFGMVRSAFLPNRMRPSSGSAAMRTVSPMKGSASPRPASCCCR